MKNHGPWPQSSVRPSTRGLSTVCLTELVLVSLTELGLVLGNLTGPAGWWAGSRSAGTRQAPPVTGLISIPYRGGSNYFNSLVLYLWLTNVSTLLFFFPPPKLTDSFGVCVRARLAPQSIVAGCPLLHQDTFKGSVSCDFWPLFFMIWTHLRPWQTG